MVQIDTHNRDTEESLPRQRFEQTLGGQALISALVSLIVLTAVAWSLPASPIRRAVMPTFESVSAVTGLDQSWRMYAPDPPSWTDHVEVHVRMADGGIRVWKFDRNDGGPFVWYRWQKLKESIVGNDHSRAEIAHWVVREMTEPSERPVRVTMLRHRTSIAPPGSSAPQKTDTTTIYDEKLPAPE